MKNIVTYTFSSADGFCFYPPNRTKGLQTKKRIAFTHLCLLGCTYSPPSLLSFTYLISHCRFLNQRTPQVMRSFRWMYFSFDFLPNLRGWILIKECSVFPSCWRFNNLMKFKTNSRISLLLKQKVYFENVFLLNERWRLSKRGYDWHFFYIVRNSKVNWLIR